MANKSVFASMKGRLLPKATTRNAEGAPAYAYSDQHALAQLAVTGTIGDGFYQDAQSELDSVLDTAQSVTPEFLAQTAIYARQSGHMKDMPAVLLAVLAQRNPVLFRAAFGRVVDNGKMLRSFVQVVRSGQTGRKSLGSAPKAMVQSWLNTASNRALLYANIGTGPSLASSGRNRPPLPQRIEIRLFSTPSARSVEIFSSPGQSSCFRQTQVGTSFAMRAITLDAICTPVTSGKSCNTNGTSPISAAT